GDVIGAGWSDRGIPWPRCRRPGTYGGGPGLLIDEELARAVRLESVLAVCHWWGVTYSCVWRRKALGVEKPTEGSARLRQEVDAPTGGTGPTRGGARRRAGGPDRADGNGGAGDANAPGHPLRARAAEAGIPATRTAMPKTSPGGPRLLRLLHALRRVQPLREA